MELFTEEKRERVAAMRFGMKKKDADMTQGTIWKHIVLFAFPTMLGLIFQQLYNTVDAIIVGQFVGKEALAAVGGTGSICNTLIGLCNGLSLGATVVISQRYGAHDNEGLKKAVHTAVAASFLLGAAATAIGIIFTEPMLHAIDTPPDVMSSASTYLTIYFAGILGQMVYNMTAAILRAVGDSQRPVLFLTVSAVINTVLDLLFVIAFRMGVAGVALATIISQAVSAVLGLVTLTREKGIFRLNWRELRIDTPSLKRIISIGSPMAVQQALTSFSNVFVQAHVNGFGSAAMAGWSTHNKLDAYVTIPITSIAQASTTFVGQNWGARQIDRARRGVRTSIMVSLASTAAVMAVILGFARPLLTLFTTDSSVLDFGQTAVMVCTPFYFCMCFNQILAGALRGVGNSKGPMLVMLGSFVLFRQLYLIVLDAIGPTFVWVAMSYPLGWMLCALLLYVLIYRKSVLCHPELAQIHQKYNAPA